MLKGLNFTVDWGEFLKIFTLVLYFNYIFSTEIYFWPSKSYLFQYGPYISNFIQSPFLILFPAFL